MRKGLISVLLSIAIISSYANNQQSKMGFDPKYSIDQLVMDHWTYKSGLSSNNINAIYQSTDGFIWLTSYSGLQRFDGVEFKRFNTNNVPVLKSNTAYKVYEDSDDNHWFTTRNGGIIGYQNGEFHEYEGNESLPNDIFGFLQAENGDFWIGTGNSGVFRKQPGQDWKQVEELDNYRVLTITEDSDNNIWIGTHGNGLFRYNTREVTQYTVEDGLSSNVILSLYVSTGSNLYISTTKGLVRWNSTGFKQLSFLDGYEINEVVEDDYQTIWVATGRGLARYNESLGIQEVYSADEGLPGMRLSSLRFDHEGSLWVGTYNTGLIRFRLGQVSTLTTKDGLASNRINIVSKIGDKILIGTEDGTVNLVQSENISPVAIGNHPNNAAIRDILKDQKGDIWVASYNGIARRRGNKTTYYTEDNGLSSVEVRRILETSTGDIWIGTRSGGLMKFNDDGNHLVYNKKTGFKSDYILAVEEDYNGNIVVGTSGGGMAIFDKDLNMTAHHPTSQKSGILIFNIHIDKENIYWLCTNLGLFRFDGKEFMKVEFSPKLSIDRFFDMVDDGIGGLWLTSDIGIFRVSNSELQKYVNGGVGGVIYNEFNEQDGLLTRECTGATRAFIDDETGLIWIPTWEGVAIIDPASGVDNTSVPNVYITSASVDETPFNVYQTGNFAPPGSFRYVFNFTSLSYLTPDRIKFKYKLEGIDEEWHGPNSKRSVEYTNLPYGEYVFRVQGSNGQNVWNEKGASLEFEVKPFLYEMTWFQASIVLAIILFVWLLYRWRVSEIKQRNVALIKINRELDSFVYRASHDLRTPVTSTMGLVNIALQEESHKDKDEYFRLIDQCARKLDHIILDIIEYSKNKNEAVEYSVFSIKDMINDILDDLKFIGDLEEIEFKTVIESENIYSDKNRIRVILSSLIMNAIQYRDLDKETSTIQIAVTKNKKNTALTVSDNGIGIPDQDYSKIFEMFYRGHHKSSGSGLGLYIVNEAAKKLQGEVSVDSQPGEGTRFELLIPHGVT